MTALRWLRAQIIDMALIAAFVLAFAAVVRGGAVGGLIAASLAVSLWLSATLVEQLKVRHVEDGGRVTPVRGWEGVDSTRGAGVARWPIATANPQVREDGLPGPVPLVESSRPIGADRFAQTPHLGWSVDGPQWGRR